MRRAAFFLALPLAAGALASCVTGEPPQSSAPIAVAAAEAPGGAIAATPMPSAPLTFSRAPTRIVFASCLQQKGDQSIWTQIASENPGLVLLMGDNVYGDVRSDDPALPELKAAYMRLAQSEPFAAVRAAAPVIAVWDDHDYGLNDAGAEFKHRDASDALFDYVWALDADDPRRQRPGVYSAWTFGPAGERLQIIALDTRYFRSPLKKTDEFGAKGKERYLPDADPAKTMLGAAQWAWLEEELKKPADLRILVSSIQVIAEGHGWEAWKALPAERQRLYGLIDKTGAENLIALSGDRHAAALYERDDVIGYPLLEATSSSLNLPAARWRAESGETYMEPGPHRLGAMVYHANYGLLDINWADDKIDVSLRGADGGVIQEKTLSIDDLK